MNGDDVLQPRDWRFPFKTGMALGIIRGSKFSTMRGMKQSNSFVGGSPWPRVAFDTLVLKDGWIDPGPSPAGNSGPYLKAPRPVNQFGEEVDTVHRVYPRVQPGDRILVCEPLVRSDAEGHASEAFYEADSVACGATWRWRVDRLSGMYLPRDLVRYAVPVLGVRPVLRASDLTDDEIQREGIYDSGRDGDFRWTWPGADVERRVGSVWCKTPRDAFRNLWESINGLGSFTAVRPCWLYEFGPKEPA
jgi:hypothetical protein